MTSERGENLRSRATKLLNAEAFDDAIELLTQAIASNPEAEWAFRLRGLALCELGDAEGALTDLSRSIELAPGGSKGWERRAEVRVATGDLAAGAADVERALELDPRSSRAWTTRATIRSKQGDLAGAHADLTRALELDPDSAWTWATRAGVRCDLGNLDGALADAARAGQLEPAHTYGWKRRADIAVRAGQFETAVEAASRVLALDPNDAWAYGTRGIARQQLRDIDGAIVDFGRAIERNPSNAWLWLQRGTARAELDDLGGAVSDFTRAAELNPEDVDTWTNRGRILFDLGDLRGAAADFTRAIELGGGTAYAYALRAKARLMADDILTLLGQSGPEDIAQDTVIELLSNDWISETFSDIRKAFELDPDLTASILSTVDVDDDHPAADHLRGVLSATRWMEHQLPGDLDKILPAIATAMLRPDVSDRLVELVALEPAVESRASNGVQGADVAHAVLVALILDTIEEFERQDDEARTATAELHSRMIRRRGRSPGTDEFHRKVEDLKARLSRPAP
jgi:tetratricopeptide (TPR) repeat protein